MPNHQLKQHAFASRSIVVLKRDFDMSFHDFSYITEEQEEYDGGRPFKKNR